MCEGRFRLPEPVRIFLTAFDPLVDLWLGPLLGVNRLELPYHSIIRYGFVRHCHSCYVDQEAYLAQRFCLAIGPPSAGLAAFCFAGYIRTWFYHHIVFRKLGKVGGNNNGPKVPNSTSFSMACILIQEAKEEGFSLSSEYLFDHG
jgi:hypothetical protein